MTTPALATPPVSGRQRLAARPSVLERVSVVAMMFFLAFSTPDQWLRTAAEVQAQDQLEGGLSIFAVALILGFAGLFAFHLAGNWRPVWWLARQDRLFLSFFGLILLSTLWSAEPTATVRETIVLLIVIFYALYLVTRFELREILRMTGIALAVGIALDFFFIFGLPEFGDSNAGWKGTQPNKNSLGRLHVLSVIVFLVGARTFRRFRFINYVLAALAMVIVIGSTSATSLVALILASAITVVAQIFRARKTLFGAVILSAVVSTLAVIGFATANLGPITDLLGKDVTFTGRTPLWEFTITESLRNPLTGYGWNAYWNGFFSPAHEVWTEFVWTPPHAHNAFIDYALQLGWPAVGLFFAIIIRAGYRAVVYVRDTRTAVGLFPLAMITFSFLYSLSEAGVIFRNIFFLLVAVAIYSIASLRHDKGVKDTETPLEGTIGLVGSPEAM